ncbi:MAG: DUF1566 domain-containing protein [Xanthomonadales bacterium]|nr:DUF1566 domain-containing protein [Xanthomonadales bacterium]
MKLKVLTLVAVLTFSINANAQTDVVFYSSFERLIVLNDTGITWAGEYPTGNSLICNSLTIKQDCNLGRDATNYDPNDGHAGFSFTKLDANGVPLVDQSVNYETIPWACVQDNVTGFVWEVKTDDGGIHDKDNTYRWGGVSAIGLGHPNAEGTYYNDWDELVNDANAGNGLCGFTNWRVPTLGELSSIVNNGVHNPTIDINYFPNTKSSYYWSASPESIQSFSAKQINFIYGSSSVSDRFNYLYIRLVGVRQ